MKPRVLFHGTTSQRAKHIDTEGLRTKKKPRWPKDGNRRFLYFVEHPDIAKGWGNMHRNNVQSVIYFVDVEGLDLSKLERDPADPIGEYGGYWRYPKNIAAKHLVRCEVREDERDGVVVEPEQREQLVRERLAEQTKLEKRSLRTKLLR